MRRTLLYLIPALLCLQSASAADLQLKWSDLNAPVIDHDVQLSLPDGTVLRGTAVAIHEDALILDVRRTSDKKVHPRGQASIPRDSVTVINVRRSRGAAGRTIGTILGVVGGIGASIGILAANLNLSTGGAIGILVGTTAGLSVAGYVAGNSLDQGLTVIHVIP